ncbi:MAG: hypothetical protein H7281_16455 [Bacteriovorax sp.]|nr:hypothetical protein [Bacteriovorax sp.]
MIKIISTFCLTFVLSLSVPKLYAQSGNSGSGSMNSGTGSSGSMNSSSKSTDSRSSNPGTNNSTDSSRMGSDTTTGSKSTVTGSSETNSMNTDTVGNMQSGTTTSDCLTIKSQGKVCGSKATTWCNNHSTSAECRNFGNKSDIDK